MSQFILARAVVHRSPHLMLGVLNHAERPAAAFEGGWLHRGEFLERSLRLAHEGAFASG